MRQPKCGSPDGGGHTLVAAYDRTAEEVSLDRVSLAIRATSSASTPWTRDRSTRTVFATFTTGTWPVFTHLRMVCVHLATR